MGTLLHEPAHYALCFFRAWAALIVPPAVFFHWMAGESSSSTPREFWLTLLIPGLLWVVAELLHAATGAPHGDAPGCTDEPRWTWQIWRDC